MRTLTKMAQVAYVAHLGQVDKSGVPYFLHVLRVSHLLPQVALRWSRYRTYDQLELSCALEVALGHDLLEDTSLTSYDLHRGGFMPLVIHAIELLTRKPDESYFGYITRVKDDDLARLVKVCDLLDNLNLARWPEGVYPPSFLPLVKRYTKALNLLLDGDEVLYDDLVYAFGSKLLPTD